MALSDPATAIEAAGKAIDLQRELGALHELGKACTALAIAQLQLGKYAESATAFQAACEALEKAKYRSGRARAELFRAVLHLRTGRLDQAIASARWAISELLAAQVYPTLIIMAARVLCHLGVDDVDVNTAAHQARDQLRPLDGRGAGVENEHRAHSPARGGAVKWQEVYAAACARRDAAAGYYNDKSASTYLRVRSTYAYRFRALRRWIFGRGRRPRCWPRSPVMSRTRRGCCTSTPPHLFKSKNSSPARSSTSLRPAGHQFRATF